ncbi:MAG: phage integrase family protein [Bryobacterales bacterium]|nr:phage integrase family protein [Bryobacterales bacterium]
MSELERQIERFVEELKRNNASPHTITAYESDLRQFVEYFSPPEMEPPGPSEFDVLKIREWLASLYDQKLSAVSIRRKLAALRVFFRFLVREGLAPINAPRLLRTPRSPKTLPDVMTTEQTNALLDGVAAGKLERPYPARDLAILEFLYGCGLRVSELVGLNLDDVDRAERWLRVRGKGRKERQVPFGGKAADALEHYLEVRNGPEAAVFLNHRGGRLTDRGVRGIIKMYAMLIGGDSSIHPHSFRHAFATHLLSDGADLRSIQELLGHARLSTTQKYTQVSLTDLMATYDRAHPKA